ncbi:MAG: hypothetical protein WBF53_13285 [Litorimonas sp.]
MRKPSIWFWIIGVLGLLWNVGGAYDYLMTRTNNADYLSNFPPEMIAYYANMPMLMDVMWPVAVWGGVLGWLLVLLRRRWAVPVFIVSLVAMAVNFVWMATTGGLALQAEAMGAGAYAFTALIVAFAVFAVWFSRRERAKGTLR